MKKPESAPLPSLPTDGSVQLHHDYQKVTFGMNLGNGHAGEKDPLQRRGQHPHGDPGRMAHVVTKQSPKRWEGNFQRSSTWTMDSSSQAYSGPEDNSTDPHETMTETSTLTFVDAHTAEESESHSLHGITMVYLKEFVLIDDDDDGDMSLREKTVTDVSAMDGKAAELVCGRLLSTSSGSLSECKDESAAVAATAAAVEPPPQESQIPHREQRCCFCTLL